MVKIQEFGLFPPNDCGVDSDDIIKISMPRSEEHTSELQSRSDLVCRLLLEKKKKRRQTNNNRPRRKSATHANIGSRGRATARWYVPDECRRARGDRLTSTRGHCYLTE